MGCFCLKSKKDLSKAGCLPLAAFGLLVAAILTAYQAWRMSEILTPNGDRGTWRWYVDCVLGTIQLLIAVLALIAIIIRWAKGVMLLVVGFKLVLVIFVFTIISAWVDWIIRLYGWDGNQKLTPTSTEWVDISVMTAIQVVFLACAWLILSCIHSLKNVIAVGGTGWEGKSYKDIRTGQVGKSTNSTTTSDDSV